MKRLAALLVFAFVLAACGGTVEETAPPASAPRQAALPAVLVESPKPYERPGGIEAADGRSYYALAGRELRRFSTLTGKITDTYRVGRGWTLAGVSATGEWVALQRGETQVLVLDATAGTIAHRVRLDGDFRVETVSAAGDFLFLQQDFVDGSYAVRGYDLAAGGLIEGSLGTKGALVKMQGLASQVVASPEGDWLLTLYVNTQTNTAFVHALNLIERIAICIDMPPPCEECDGATLTQWSLALAPGGRTLYGANPAAGRVAVLDLSQARLVDEGAFAPSPGTTTRAAVAKNGRLLFTNGSAAWSFDPATSAVKRLAAEA